jgi:acetolactate synthase-1/2/3 large subunit
MATLGGGELVVKALKQEGIDVIFSLNGGHIAPIYDACLDEKVRIIDVRHEEAAGHMAHAYSRITGKIGVAAVSAGPGVTNIVTAVANAYQAGSPLLVIGGKAPLKQFELGALQDIPQVEIMAPITKWSRTILETARIPEYLSIAFRQAVSGRPGPVYVEIPTDILRARTEFSDSAMPTNYRTGARAQGDPVAVAKAIELLQKAKRPLVVAGSGVVWSGASEELRRFVDSTGFPVLTTSVAKGCVPSSHPQHFPAARSAAMSQADVILIVGTRFNFVMGYGRPPRLARDVKVIQVDIDPSEIGRNRPVDIGIVGDAKMVLQQLADTAGGDITEWLTVLRAKNTDAEQRLEPSSKSDARPIHPLRLCREVQACLDDSTVVVADGGDIFSFARVAIQVNRPGHWLEPGAFGCLGVGVPFAIAAKVAGPEKRVICITGDGAFGLTGMEMDTAVRHKLPIVVVISNNAAWGIERTSQIEDFGPDRIIGTELNPSRYDLLVQALGGYGELVEDPDQIRPALLRAFASGLPACLNVMTDRCARSPDAVRGLARVPDEQPLGWK